MNQIDVLISGDIEKVFEEELPKIKTEVNIVSAFCKITTLKLIDSLITHDVKKRLLVRFLPSDIISGATDKEIYSYCLKNGWDLYIDNSLHAKTYVFDHIKCILGSANATNKGLGLANNSNKEASAFFELKKEDYQKILTLYKDAILLNDEIFDEIIKAKDDSIIIKMLKFMLKQHKIECLMPEDFPNDLTDTIELYGLKSYKWLVNYLKSKEDNKVYFGELTAQIHNIFIKDPRPYRKDIKQHLKDLLECIKKLEIKEILISRPNYSECVELRDR